MKGIRFAGVSGGSWRACLGVRSVFLFLCQIYHWWCRFHFGCVSLAWKSRLIWSTWGRSCCWSIRPCASHLGVWLNINLRGGAANRAGCAWLRVRHGRKSQSVLRVQTSLTSHDDNFAPVVITFPLALYVLRELCHKLPERNSSWTGSMFQGVYRSRFLRIIVPILRRGLYFYPVQVPFQVSHDVRCSWSFKQAWLISF